MILGDVMINQINNILSTSKTVAIIGHINPDGDCFGSISGMFDYINDTFGITAHCFADCNAIAEEFQAFVEDLIFNPEPLSQYDACICVDCADEGRLGKYADIFNNSTHTICIDHHKTNIGFADINIVADVSSNCENIYYLLKSVNFEARLSTLSKLFAGILTDTANLSVDTVGCKTFMACAEMKARGVDIYKIKQFFFGGNSMAQFKLLTIAMSSAKFYNNNTIMVMNITQDQMDEIGAVQEDLSPIIGKAFCMKHALFGLLITPRNAQVHVSFRAKHGLDVSTIAQHFGGGGHTSAAAFTAPKFDEDDLNYVINTLSNQIDKLSELNNNIFD